MELTPPPAAVDSGAGRLHRHMLPLAGALLVVALIWHVSATVSQPGARWIMPDLEVYRAAVDAALAGQPVYAGGFTAGNLPWLYPPFALLALAPLATVPQTVAKVTMSVLGLVALGLMSGLSWQATPVVPRWRPTLGLVASAVLLASEPVQQNLAMGQVNLVLAVLVLNDVLLPSGHRARGYGVGLAAGIKLTPALIAIYYLFRRDWGAARNAALTFALSVVVGAVAFPAQSWTYWTQAAFASRIGPAHLGNQSLLGVLLRLGAVAGLDADAVRSVWFPFVVATALAGTWALAQRDLDRLATYCGLAAITLLVSPLSWTPHWVALAPAVVWLAGRQPGLIRCCAVLAGAGLLLFAWPVDGVWSGLIWLVYPADYWPTAPPPLRTSGWLLFGSLYPILAVAMLTVVLRSGRRVPLSSARPTHPA
jgi:alpha-1,2-mannosyltransferase